MTALLDDFELNRLRKRAESGRIFNADTVMKLLDDVDFWKKANQSLRKNEDLLSEEIKGLHDKHVENERIIQILNFECNRLRQALQKVEKAAEPPLNNS